jgi:hypothetical protein
VPGHGGAHPTLQAWRAYSKTLAERCHRQGESLLCSDVKLESELVSSSSMPTGRWRRSSARCCASPRNRLGVLHLDRSPYQEPFTEADFFLADALPRACRSASRASWSSGSATSSSRR